MASSGEQYVTVIEHLDRPVYYYRFSWWVKSQSAEDNTSTIGWRMTFFSENEGKTDGSGTPLDLGLNSNTAPYTVTIGDVICEGEARAGDAISGEAVVKHNPSGTKTFYYYVSRGFKTGLVCPATLWVELNETVAFSGDGVLPEMNRSASVSAENGTLGQKQTINITRAVSKLTCTIEYTCGNDSGIVCENTTESSVSFTPPVSLAENNTAGESVSIVLKVTSYDGDEETGTKSITITCAIPASVVPSVSLYVTDTTEYADEFGKYVQGNSSLLIQVSAEGVYGSKIQSYKTTADGRTYTTASIETAVLKGSGEIEIKSTVTDSRGRTATATKIISVYAYTAPTITNLSAHRSNRDGVADQSGDYLCVTFGAEIVALGNKNAADYTLRYKKVSDAAFAEISLSDYSGRYSISGAVCVFEADKRSSYDIEIVATDTFNPSRRVTIGSSGAKFFSFLDGGKGIAFNKYAEQEGVFDIGFLARFSGGIYHPVLEDNINLDDVMTPNTYVGKNAIDSGYYNCPHSTNDPFMLEVLPAGTEGHLVHRITVCNNISLSIYTRAYCFGEWGAWQTVYDESSGGSGNSGGNASNTDIPVMTENTIGGAKLGSNLKISDSGHLYVDTADAAEEDNTKPITSAAVHVVVGNIDVLLGTI